jgi:erythronate-4-phosphate dehydrogenase
MRIVCGTNIPFAREAFGTLGEVEIVPGRSLNAGAVREADALVVRSTTKVNRALLEGSRVRFVGTTTIGTDHMDLAWLDARGIRWCAAPGSNANSVSEYVTAALLCLGRRHGFALAGRTMGIVGVGNVGTRVAAKAEALGLRVLRNDPPLERAGGAGYVGLDELLEGSDIVSFHVPLTREGPDATHHMAGRALFARLRPGAIVLNAARGAVVATDDLLAARASGRVAHLVLDCWEGEPAYRLDALAAADLGSPHIAGHSFDGKVAGTTMAYEDLCRFLGVPAAWSPAPCLPPPPVPSVELDARDRPEEAVLDEAVRAVYDLEADDRRFRATAAPDATSRAAAFDDLRTNYPERREFRFTRLTLRNASPVLARKAAGLGFSVQSV